jgi:hypothetical protein
MKIQKLMPGHNEIWVWFASPACAHRVSFAAAVASSTRCDLQPVQEPACRASDVHVVIWPTSNPTWVLDCELQEENGLTLQTDSGTALSAHGAELGMSGAQIARSLVYLR